MQTSVKKPSKYQEEIYKTYNQTNKNIFVQAAPGSGKSYTILQLLKQTPVTKKAIFLAFNKSIAEELTAKVGGWAEVSTLHSLGFKLLRENLGKQLIVSDNKSFKIANKFFRPKFELIFPNEKGEKRQKKENLFIFQVMKMYDLYRMNLTENNPESLQKLSDYYNVDFPPKQLYQLVKFFDFAEKEDNESGSEMNIDFTDMLWLVNKHITKNQYPKFDVVFVDEVQDINPIQKFLIDNIISKRGRFVAVGDEYQSIYAFMGANINSLQQFKNAPNTEILPLSVSYRCGKKITEMASRIFPGVESFEGNIEGEIKFGDFSNIKTGDFVICRNNLPLINTYIYLISKGIKAKILGKDLGFDLLKLIQSIDDIKELDERLLQKKEELSEKGINSPENNPSYLLLLEKVLIIKAVESRVRSLKETEKMLSQMFSETYTESDVVLMTGHKSKGLENDRVIFLYPELIPSKYARTHLELYQEKCLEYVIVTRAKKELIIINGDQEL
jgi:superfamily I DNA/RNA helicase